MTTPTAHQLKWSSLLRIARSLIAQVNSTDKIIDRWTLGGGTAMMIRIDHRESDDIDIFLSDPQVLAFLDPARRDFLLEINPSDYHGDGSVFSKWGFAGLGEIDFIVGQSLTSMPSTDHLVDGEVLLLETIPEVVAKKIYHRALSIRPRDIFDIAAASETHADAVVHELSYYKDAAQKALRTMESLNPDFVALAISQLAIKPAFEAIALSANDRAKELVRAALS